MDSFHKSAAVKIWAILNLNFMQNILWTKPHFISKGAAPFFVHLTVELNTD
jgi:hypothetical protein